LRAAEFGAVSAALGLVRAAAWPIMPPMAERPTAERFDVIVIGGGIAGASIAGNLAAHRRVLLLEAESQPGYHTSGRSAALYSEAYGNAVVRALSTGSRGFFEAPGADFAGFTLTRPRGAMHLGGPADGALIGTRARELGALVASVRPIDAAEARRIVPVLRPEMVTGAVWEPDALDLDTNGMLQGYLRMARRAGGVVHTDRRVEALAASGGLWRATAGDGAYEAPVVVNAGGAWADHVASLAGLAGVGVVPKRRTAFLVDPPAGVATDAWPLVVALDETWYVKPDAGKLLISPADETPSPPCDAQPEELDIAVAVDRVQTATTLEIRRIAHRWAGLRCFARDKTPVVGFDPRAPGFFWCAGQGGYGFQTAPALSRAAAALACGEPLPADLAALGVTAAALSPARLL
jgi:D-arginine dehydrogenase